MSDAPPPPPPPPPESFGSPRPAGGGVGAGAAISYGWKKFQQHAGPILAVVLIPLLAELVIGAVQVAFSSWFLRLVVGLVGFIVGHALALGIYRVGLMVTAGETPDLGRAYTYDRWAEWIVFSIVFGLMVTIGLYLCLIPGLFVLAFFGMAPYFFIDRDMTLGEALQASRQAASDKSLALPVLLTVLFAVLGLIACLIGVFVTAAISYVGVAFLYRYAVGESVVA